MGSVGVLVAIAPKHCASSPKQSKAKHSNSESAAPVKSTRVSKICLDLRQPHTYQLHYPPLFMKITFSQGSSGPSYSDCNFFLQRHRLPKASGLLPAWYWVVGQLLLALNGVLHAGVLFPGEKHAVGTQPHAVIAADFNGDGIPDLATSNSNSGNVSVLMGTGGGSFAPRVNFSAGSAPDTLAAADFNGDGKTDLVVADRSLSKLVVRLGNGNGTFQAASNANGGGGFEPYAVITGDFNGDGKVDLAASNHYGYTSVSTLLGNGDGTFQTARSYDTGRGDAYALVAADFNGDGKVDFAVPNFQSDEVSVLLGNGDGTLQAAKIISTGSRPTSITAADFNGDGKVDIATAGNSGDNVSVLRGIGDGNFQAMQNYAVGDQPRSLASGDFNGDGKPDLATANYNSYDVSVLLGNGNGTFQAQRRFEVGDGPGPGPGPGPWWLIARDLDGDGKIDLATANVVSADISILPGVGDGSFHIPRRFASANSPRAVVTADFNRDGKNDLVTANSSSNDVGVLLGNGDGTLQPVRKFSVGYAVAAATADFNGDEKADIVVANGNTSTDVSVLIGNGDGSFQSQRRFSVGGVPNSIVAVDLNSDGKMDLATANSSPSNLSVLIGNGDGTFQTRILIPAGTSLRGLVAGDFNRDGNKDLVTANSTTPAEVSVLLGNGDGTLQAPRKFTVGSSPVSVTTADFNGDDYPDLAIANQSSNDISVLLGNGDGTFEAERRIPSGVSQQAIIAADFNGDGKVDLSVASAEAPHGVSVLLGMQNGNFESRRQFRSCTQAYGLAATDLNGDGKTDLAAATSASEVAVLLRLGPDARNDLGRFGTGGNNGTYTIRVTGGDFGIITGARLVGSGGFDRPALVSYWEDNGEYYATFDLRGAAVGKYDVRFTTSGGGSTLVPQSLVVVNAPAAGPVIPRLIAPSAIRRGREYNFTVEWENTSLNDAVPPLISVGNTTSFGIAPKDRSCGSHHTFLGVNMHAGPPGILRPGQRVSVTFWADSGTEDGSYLAWADREIKNLAAPFDWAGAIRPLRPDGMTDVQVSSLAAELAAIYGSNNGGYLAALSAFANSEWEKTRNPHELLHHEVLRAWSRITGGVWGTVTGINPPPGGHVVRLKGQGTGGNWQTLADRLGRFYFSDLVVGSYQLSVERGKLTNPAQGNVVLSGAASAGPVALAVTSASQFVVQIDLRDGTPMPGVGVIPWRNGGSFEPSVTDEEGRATFYGLEPGTYDLIVLDVEGCFRRHAGLAVPEISATIPVPIDLAQAVVRGTLPPDTDWHPILVPAGEPHEGRIEFIPATVEGNEFTIQAPAGEYRLMVYGNAGNRVAEAGPWAIIPEDEFDLGILQPSGAPSSGGAGEVRWLLDADVYPYFFEGLQHISLDAIHAIDWRNRDPDWVWAELGTIVQAGSYLEMGPSYSTLVSNFLDIEGPRHRSFGNGTMVVEDTSHLGATKVGLRNVPQTKLWLKGLAIKSAMYLKNGIASGVFDLEPGENDEIDILGVKFQDLIPKGENGDHETNALFNHRGRMDFGFFQFDPNFIYNFDIGANTVVGGCGQYGTPPRVAPTPQQVQAILDGMPRQDARWVAGGTIKLKRDCDGKYSAELCNVKLHVHDGFDFFPGNLGVSDNVIFATTILAFLEINDRARDVVLDIEWTDETEISLDLGELSRRQTTSPCFKPDDQKSIERPTSCDPNDIIGPAGVGPLHHVSADAVMPYRIRFENLASQATAPAAMVTITHQLDADLDWSTFKLGNIGLGDLVIEVPPDLSSHEFQVDLRDTRGVFVDVKADLDMTTGLARWDLVAIDPATGELPEDPFVGFLPPNVIAPEGEGFVDYEIHPKRPAVAGTRIDAAASIVFDANPPILTAPIFHTLDDGPPTIELNVVQAGVGGTRIDLQWSGDDRGGAGISSYDVAVSVDGGDFVPWLTDTEETQATYSGYFGQTVGFQVTTRDLLGQQSPSPPVASFLIADDPYVSWRIAKFSNAVENPALRNSLWGDDADPDADGVSNLFEFVAATNPLQRDAGLAGALRTGGGKAVFVHRQTRSSSPTVEHRIEWSPDLEFWDNNGLVDILVEDQGGYLDLETQFGTAGLRRAFFRRVATHKVIYSLWLHEEGVAEQDGGPEQDPNGDGISNAVAYAFGLPATAAAPEGDLGRLPQNVVVPVSVGPIGGGQQLQDWRGLRFSLPISSAEDAVVIVESGSISNAGPWQELARKTGRSDWTVTNPLQTKVITSAASAVFEYSVLEPKEGLKSYRARVEILE